MQSLRTIFFSAGIIFFFTVTVFAQTNELDFPSPESIQNFNAIVEVRQDSSVHVTETIVYNFGNNQKRGTYRDIPLSDAPGTFDRLSISNINVTDEWGASRTFVVSGNENHWYDFLLKDSIIFDIVDSPILSLRIGDTDRYVTGIQIYVISYDVKNALGYFTDINEIYWNITGNDWKVPIQHTSARVLLPGNQQALKIASFCGTVLFQTPCKSASTTYNTKTQQTELSFESEQPFSLSEGMTVAVGFPKGVVASPSKLEQWRHKVAQNWQFLLPIVVIVWWFKRKLPPFLRLRRFKKTHTLIAQYDGGECDPLETAVLTNYQLKLSDYSAQIIYLATLGYLKISRDESGSYAFIGLGKDNRDLPDHSRILLTNVSDKNLSELTNSFTSVIRQVQDSLKQQLVLKGYFIPNTNFVTSSSGSTSAFLYLFLAVNPGIFVFLGLGMSVGTAFSGTMFALAALSLLPLNKVKNHTDKGLEAEQYLLGLKQYIEVAEEDRIKFHNAPEKKPELFEKLLPYAMVFGLEDKWAKEFEDIYTVSPTWYAASDGRLFTSIALASQLSSFSTQTQTAFTPHAIFRSGSFGSGSSFGSSSSSSGSSSGSSGGGGGGGGGGSW